jgi:hypothetical protein
MDVFFQNPEPAFLVADRLMTDYTDPIHHAHCIDLVVTQSATRFSHAKAFAQE